MANMNIYINGNKPSASEYEKVLHSDAFRRGFYTFTTMAYLNDQGIQYLVDHIERLQKASHWLFGKKDDNFFLDLNQRLSLLNFELNSIIRVSILNIGEDFMDIMQVYPLKVDVSNLSLKSILIEGYRDKIPTFFKSPQYLTQMKIESELKKEGFDYALIVDVCNNIIESSIANIFFIKEKSVYFVDSDKMLYGIAQKKLEIFFQKIGFDVVKSKISLEQVEKFDECYLCNSLNFFKPVQKIDQTNFQNSSYNLLKEKWKNFQTTKG